MSIKQLLENRLNLNLSMQKKGDLAHIRVHKFSVHDEQVLLGYNWNEGSLTLTLMSLGPHENFYRKLKQRRQADLKLLKD